MSDVTFRKTKGWDQAFNSPNGPVGRQLKRDARQVEQMAKTMVNVESGQLRRSIAADKLPRPTVTGPQIEVAATAPHAVFHHEGTKPGPRRASDGSTYMHPGSPGEPFLSDPMVAVTAKYT